MGAVMVSTPLKTLKGAVGRLVGVFLDSSPDLKGVMKEVIGYASKARKQGWSLWSKPPTKSKIRSCAKP